MRQRRRLVVLLIGVTLLAGCGYTSDRGSANGSDACHGLTTSDVEETFGHHGATWAEAEIDGGCEWRPEGSNLPRIELWVSDDSRTSTQGTAVGASFQYPDDRHLHLMVQFGQASMTPEEFAAEEAALRALERRIDLPR